MSRQKMMHSDERNRQDAFSIYCGRKLATVLLLTACSCSRIILMGPCKVPFSQLCVGGRQKSNRVRRRHTVGCNSMSIPQKEKIIAQKACPRMDPFRLCIVVYDSYPFFRLIFCHGDERSRVMGTYPPPVTILDSKIKILVKTIFNFITSSFNIP